MVKTLENIEQQFNSYLSDFVKASPLLRGEMKKLLLSQADALLRKPAGRDFLYRKIPDLVEAGIFQQTVWQEPKNLEPGLVGGTLMAGPSVSTIEALSEMRLMAVLEGIISYPDFSADAAKRFLQDCLVSNFDLAFERFEAPAWKQYPAGELKKIRLLFDMILEKIPLQSIKKELSEEIAIHAAHRPINASKAKLIIKEVNKLALNGEDSTDGKLLQFRQALICPTPTAQQNPDVDSYLSSLQKLSSQDLAEECEMVGEQMLETGLVSDYQVGLLRFVATDKPALIPVVLQLDAHGIAEFDRHQAFVRLLIAEFITYAIPQAVYGLARVLQRNLFSRKITWHAFNRLIRIKIAPAVQKKLKLGNLTGVEVTPIQLLVGGTLCVLGQPLGIRQGNNPTCQSARGISMWSRNAPGKLLNLLMDAATSNNLIFRFNGKLIESAKTALGLVQKLDYKLDPVSIVLVPHLDRIYNAMMSRAALEHPGADPHVFVNPAFYGHWIQTGFRSVFNPILLKIDKYKEFVRIFYASYHPEYNGGYHISYPSPLGIFITNSLGEMLGYHAISLLRVSEDNDGQWRAYFFNPNSEGQQNWGQGIKPSVSGNGERYGESSLPFYQFVARVYAFHFNKLQLNDKHEKVPKEEVNKIDQIARESWGRKYRW